MPSECEAMRGVGYAVRSTPPHLPFGHLLPAGEKREKALRAALFCGFQPLIFLGLQLADERDDLLAEMLDFFLEMQEAE